MTAELVVHMTQRATPRQSAWLRRLLEPVVVACRFDRSIPIEIRPTGRWAGWSQHSDCAPDRRICISSHVSFWTRQNIVDVYLHEGTHRLLNRMGVDSHGPEFLCLNAILLLRSAEFFSGAALESLTFYDFQDRPESLTDIDDWRGLVIEWALPVAAEIASTDASAEDLAHVVCARWKQFVDDREASQLRAQRDAVKGALQAQTRAEELEDLLSSRSLWRAVALVGWVSFAAVGWFVFKGFLR